MPASRRYRPVACDVCYNQADLQPQRIEHWLNHTPADPEEFATPVTPVGELYPQAPALHPQGVRLMSTAEKTGIQALERAASTRPMTRRDGARSGRVERQEYEYLTLRG